LKLWVSKAVRFN